MPTYDQALAQLKRQCASNQPPILGDADWAALLEAARRPDPFGWYPDNLAVWRATTGYALNDPATPTTRNGHFYVVTTAGTSGATQPAWPLTTGATVADGSVVWTEAGLAHWSVTYDLDTATVAGWELKAGQTAGYYQISDVGQTLARQQIHDHCLAMAKQYRRRVTASIPITGRDYRPSVYPNQDREWGWWYP